jgi:hypothetical protein
MKYSLRTFGDIIAAIIEELKIQKTDLESIRRIRRNVNTVYLNEVVPFKRWQWLRSTTTLANEPAFILGTANVQQNLVTVTLTQAPTTSRKGYFFSADGQSDSYKVSAHTAGSLTLTLETPFNGATNAATSFKLWTDSIPLPADCKEVVEVSHQRFNSPIQGVGIQEMRRLQGATLCVFGLPKYYSTGPFVEQDDYVGILALPVGATRSSNGLMKTLTFAADVSTTFVAGDHVLVSGAGDYTYNGEVVLSSVDGNSISYVGTSRMQESAVADVAYTVQAAASPGAASHRNLIIYPAISDQRVSLLVDYQLNVEELDSDTDEPKMPVENRIALFYGGMWLSANRERDAEWAQENYALMQKTLMRMAGKTEDTPERPVLRMSRAYLSTKRRAGSRTGDFGSDFIGNGGGSIGSPTVATGTANTVAVFNEQGLLVGSDEVIPGSLDGNSIGYVNTGTTISAVTLQNAITELDGDNVAQDAAISSAATTAGNAAASIAAHVSATSAHGTVGSVVGTTDTQTLNNKTLDSPVLTGLPVAPTAANGTNTTQLATTAFVLANAGSPTLTADRVVISDGTGTLATSSVSPTELSYLSGATSSLQTQIGTKAPLASPALTGTPTAPTASAMDNSTKVATTAYVDAAIATAPGGVTSVYGRTGAVSAAAGDYTADKVTNTPAGNISSTDVQSALNELDTEKADASATTSSLALKAPLASPALTGTPTAPTATAGTNSTQLATTAYADGAVSTLSGTTTTALALKAPIASPTFTGVPAAPTATAGTSTTQLATTAFVTTADNLKAPLASPSLTGTPLSTTAVVGTNTTQIATTAFVKSAIDQKGIINYVTVADGSATTGFATYNDGSSAAPVDGTGGTPTITLASSGTTPLRGASSLLLTKGASNVQGQGFSYAFTIDSVDQAKACRFAFDYKIASGTYVDADMTCWLFDVTNSVLIQPTAYTILNIGGSGTTKICEFQTSSNSVSYRAIWHIASTSALAYTMQVDNVVVSPNTYNIGASFVNLPAFTPTFTALGTPANVSIQWYRDGIYLKGVGSLTTGTRTGTIVSMSLPPGLTIDTSAATGITLLNTTAAPGTMVGQWAADTSGYSGTIVTAPGTSTALVYFGNAYQNAATGLTPVIGTSAFPSTSVLSINLSLPILGWGTSQVLSSDTATNVVAASANCGAATTSTPTGTRINFSTVSFDTVGAITTGVGTWAYTVKVPGKYRVSAGVFIAVSGSSFLVIYQNGTVKFEGGLATGTGSLGETVTVNGLLDCIAGDVIYIGTLANTFSLPGAPQDAFINIERLSGPAQIASSETVAASYWSSGNTSMSSSTPLNADTKFYDTHGAVTTGAAWKFTAPIPGKYTVKYFINNSGSVSSSSNIQIFKNGTAYKSIGYVSTTASLDTESAGVGDIQLLAGDYIDVRSTAAYPAYGGSQAIASCIDILRVGN